jgi:hypothetical protein
MSDMHLFVKREIHHSEDAGVDEGSVMQETQQGKESHDT